MMGSYIGTGTSGTTTTESWRRIADSTPAIYETTAQDLSELETDRRDTTGTADVQGAPVIRGRRREVTRPAVDPFAEALFIAGYLPYEALRSTLPPEEVRYEKENVIRVALLARKYVAREFSPEQEARLEIATERVRRLLPRVTESDFLALANELLRLDDIKREHDRIRKDAGLKE